MFNKSKYYCFFSHILGSSRRDDIVAIFYVLLFLRDGNLPWILDKNKDLHFYMKNVAKRKKLFNERL